MDSVPVQKRALRKEVSARRKGLQMAVMQEAGERMAKQLLTSELYRESNVIFCYVSMPQEPDTRRLIEQMWLDGKTVCVPRCLPGNRMDVQQITSWDDCAPGMLGILEPLESAHKIHPDLIELALIPCVSAWYDGARLGHGGGYYDLFLGSTNAKKVCLCFEALLCTDIPLEDHDIKMEYLATENGLFHCSI